MNERTTKYVEGKKIVATITGIFLLTALTTGCSLGTSTTSLPAKDTPNAVEDVDNEDITSKEDKDSEVNKKQNVTAKAGESQETATNKQTNQSSNDSEDQHSSAADNRNAKDEGVTGSSANNDSDNKPEIESTISIVVIQPLHSLPPLTLEPHEPLPEISGKFKMNNSNLIGPIYQKNWRVQVVDFKRSSSGTQATIEFGNTSDSSMTITNDNLMFLLTNQDGSNVPSNIVGGSVTVNPNEVKRITVTSPSGQVGQLWYKFDGYESAFFFFKEKLITDVTPVDTNDLFEHVQSDFPFQVAGNGKFKFQATGVTITANKSIGSLKVKDDEYILLTKVRIANTSNEELVINRYGYNRGDAEKGQDGHNIVILKEDVMKALGDKGLPSRIAPHTIAEGYIPVVFGDGNQILGALADSNFGKFAVNGVERLSAWR